jgi:hypothetical protein
MSILTHALWPELAPYFRIERYAPDGGHKRPRIRIEVRALPPALHDRVTTAEMPCVACGAPIRFVRDRAAAPKRGSPKPHLYYAATCELRVSMGCARGAAARDEYARVRQVLEREEAA